MAPPQPTVASTREKLVIPGTSLFFTCAAEDNAPRRPALHEAIPVGGSADDGLIFHDGDRIAEVGLCVAYECREQHATGRGYLHEESIAVATVGLLPCVGGHREIGRPGEARDPCVTFCVDRYSRGSIVGAAAHACDVHDIVRVPL